MATPTAATFRRMESNAQVEIWRGGYVARSSPGERVAWDAVPGASGRCVATVAGQRDRHCLPRRRWLARDALESVAPERRGTQRRCSRRRRRHASAACLLRRARVERR
eukprot:5499585-Pleurochrysis_carterae.AAC.1